MHLPNPVPQPGEMEDVRWFHRDWIRAAVTAQHAQHATAAAAAGAGRDGDGSSGAQGEDGGSVLRGLLSAGAGSEVDYGGFEIPGGYSLAHLLITGWLKEGGGGGGGSEQQQPWVGDAIPQVCGVVRLERL